MFWVLILWSFLVRVYNSTGDGGNLHRERGDMRILGLDIGMRRIGVALSDAMGWTAQPLETVQVHKDGRHLRRIAALCKEHNAEHVVAGVPYEMDGREGPSVRRVRKVLKAIEPLVGMEIEEIDERLTTKQAERVLIQADMSRKRRKQVVDQLAASLILQGYLDSKRG